MTIALRAEPDNVTRGYESLTEFCHQMLLDLPRSDQRRWGEIYLRGLVSLCGRKSIRRISEEIAGGGADQGIQQFVNQSPWDWAPVRRNLATYAVALLGQPRAWVVEEVVTPKNGASSVGVARQYAPSLGRTLNCQIGLGLFLTGDAGAVPVNWRLLLPSTWDQDEVRRARTHLPAEEVHRPRWRYVLDMADEMVGDWGVDPTPVVVDARHESTVDRLVLGLEERELPYVIAVAPGSPVLADQPVRTAGRAGTSLVWRDTAGAGLVSRFFLQQLPGRVRAGSLARGRSRGLLTEWPAGRPRPTGAWLTNLTTVPPAQLIGLARIRHQARQEMSRLYDEFGLNHFEGRSFRGWQHHVTLVSLAQAFVLGHRLRDREESPGLRRSPA
ncbi:IS701 family transposase [Micromonospora sp. NBS 11-29]|uniref:IS701 family transposase n=1 Tax=Micromonospora sp. NBS 11-29 TaxID=1960879 RepID=UPI0015943162|nr:IS701 family transposase [Micromonospora sp. NBS 11-29]